MEIRTFISVLNWRDGKKNGLSVFTYDDNTGFNNIVNESFLGYKFDCFRTHLSFEIEQKKSLSIPSTFHRSHWEPSSKIFHSPSTRSRHLFRLRMASKVAKIPKVIELYFSGQKVLVSIHVLVSNVLF